MEEERERGALYMKRMIPPSLFVHNILSHNAGVGADLLLRTCYVSRTIRPRRYASNEILTSSASIGTSRSTVIATKIEMM
jgi:hypothetical protein